MEKNKIKTRHSEGVKRTKNLLKDSSHSKFRCAQNDEVRYDKIICHPELRKANKRETSFVSLRPSTESLGVSGSSQHIDKILNKVQFPEIHRFMLQNDNIVLLKKKVAFTLAEVLITLSILGIVAAIAIPNLIQNYKKQYTISRLKQAYSIVTEATRRAEILSGTNSDNWNLTNVNDVKKYIYPQLNIAHNCGTQGGSCIGTHRSKLKDGAVNANGGKPITSTAGYTYIDLGNNSYWNVYYAGTVNGVILKNGMSIGTNCSPLTYVPIGGGGSVATYYCQILIDIDGPEKGANTMNKDIFTLFITQAEADTVDKNPRFHYGTVSKHFKRSGIDSECSKSSGCLNVKNYCTASINSTCLAYIIYSGWKIPNNYPEKF